MLAKTDRSEVCRVKDWERRSQRKPKTLLFFTRRPSSFFFSVLFSLCSSLTLIHSPWRNNMPIGLLTITTEGKVTLSLSISKRVCIIQFFHSFVYLFFIFFVFCRSCVAIAGADYCVIAADTRMSTGYNILTRDYSKISQLYVFSPKLLILALNYQFFEFYDWCFEFEAFGCRWFHLLDLSIAQGTHFFCLVCVV